jgi:hypothetical protein
MIRRKTTLRSKSGGGGPQNGNGNGNPRALVDEVLYRNHLYFVHSGLSNGETQRDPQYSGWANATRSPDFAIFLPKAHILD